MSEAELDKRLIFRFSKRTLIFNNKQCHILMLKNITDMINWKEATYQAKSLKMLTAVTSHEIRSPIQSVQQMIEGLLTSVKGQEQRICLEAGRSAMKILSCRTNDLLDLNVLENLNFNKVETQFNILKTLADTIAVMKFECQIRGIQIYL